MGKLKFIYLAGLLCSGLLFSTAIFSQERKEINDSTGTSSYILTRGQEAIVRYDSAYIMNKRLYFLLKSNYDNVRSGNRDATTKKLFVVYDSIISVQDGMIRTRTEDYKMLKGAFDSFSVNTKTFVDKTENNVNAIDKSVANAAGYVGSIKTILGEAIDKIKLQQKQKFKLFIGGLAVGVGVTSLIFLIAK